jgi:hypothetical protein
LDVPGLWTDEDRLTRAPPLRFSWRFAALINVFGE